jgi:hypothetical protein
MLRGTTPYESCSWFRRAWSYCELLNSDQVAMVQVDCQRASHFQDFFRSGQTIEYPLFRIVVRSHLPRLSTAMRVQSFESCWQL